jgi:hypothetical protein
LKWLAVQQADNGLGVYFKLSQKNEVRITRDMVRDGFTYPPHVADRAVRTVCHQFEKICHVVPTK